MECIKIEDLTFTYPLCEKPAVSGICLAAEKGDFITICGKSGCGKSTLLRCLKPAIAPNGEKKGRIYFEGNDISKLSQRQQAEKIGFVFQDPENQIVTDKVWHELAFGLESLSYPTSEIRGRVAEMASFFGIQAWFHKKVSELSGGQKQLLNLASVMVLQPSVLILDEPTSQLDPIAAQDFLETVRKINRELGVTVILTEHRLEEAFSMSDRVIVIDGGKIIADDTPQNVGYALRCADNDMLSALPTPMRVYYSVKSDKLCPVTVRDGRKWLSDMPVKNDIDVIKTQTVNRSAVLTLSDVWFRYEKDMPDVLKGLSLSLREGELYAIVGGNGTGKTTALKLAAGINHAYRGKIEIKSGKKTAALPQDPQSLFVKKTLRLDLCDVLKNQKLTKEQQESEIDKALAFCGLKDLADRHPYDLSGGEQQRAALAKVLLTKPDILFLDEPTKGLDAHFKIKLAKLLDSLKKSGVAILMVSHDIEFCAKYADRCGMFFDGMIISEDVPRKFFAGKSFYTTSAARMSGGIIDEAVLDSDIIYAIGGTERKTEDPMIEDILPNKKQEKSEVRAEKRISKKNIIFGVVSAILFGVIQFVCIGKYGGTADILLQIAGILTLGTALVNFLPRRRTDNEKVRTDRRKLPVRTIAAAFMIILLIPITILTGVYYMGDRKYYFISILIILETIVPFLMVFEGRKPQAKELVIISALCAIAVAGRCAFAVLPQFKPIAAVVIIAGVCFGGETGFLVGAVTGFVSNFFFGQGPWTPWQMFAFGIIGFSAGILFQKGIISKSKIGLSIFGFLATLIIYGGIMNPSSVIMWQADPEPEMILSSYVMGLPFDVIHALSTAFFLFFAAEPMCEKLERIKLKYGLN